jgi:hypothetical protein
MILEAPSEESFQHAFFNNKLNSDVFQNSTRSFTFLGLNMKMFIQNSDNQSRDHFWKIKVTNVTDSISLNIKIEVDWIEENGDKVRCIMTDTHCFDNQSICSGQIKRVPPYGAKLNIKLNLEAVDKTE